MTGDTLIIQPIIPKLIVSTPVPQLTVNAPGPQGATGSRGTPGTGTASAVLGQNVTAYSLLVLINGQLFLADPTNTAHASLVCGVAMQSGITGTSIFYQILGEVDGGSFVAGTRYYAGPSGSLITSPGSSAWQKSIGIGISSSSFLVQMGPSILT